MESKRFEEKVAKLNTTGVHRTNNEQTSTIQATVVLKKASSVLLATALIGVRNKDGSVNMLRALLDQGSQSAFITENAAQTLRLPRKSASAIVSGIGASTQSANHTIDLNIFPRFESNFNIACEAIVLSRLTRISYFDYDKNDFEFVNNLTLADPSFLHDSD